MQEAVQVQPAAPKFQRGSLSTKGKRLLLQTKRSTKRDPQRLRDPHEEDLCARAVWAEIRARENLARLHTQQQQPQQPQPQPQPQQARHDEGLGGAMKRLKRSVWATHRSHPESKLDTDLLCGLASRLEALGCEPDRGLGDAQHANGDDDEPFTTHQVLAVVLRSGDAAGPVPQRQSRVARHRKTQRGGVKFKMLCLRAHDQRLPALCKARALCHQCGGCRARPEHGPRMWCHEHCVCGPRVARKVRLLAASGVAQWRCLLHSEDRNLAFGAKVTGMCRVNAACGACGGCRPRGDSPRASAHDHCVCDERRNERPRQPHAQAE